MTIQNRYPFRMTVFLLLFHTFHSGFPESRLHAKDSAGMTETLPYPVTSQIDIVGPANAMGDAQTAVPNGLMSLTSNPAHAAMIRQV